MHDGRSKGIVQCILFELQITIFLSSPPPVFRQKYGGQLSISNSLGYIQKSKNNCSEWFFMVLENEENSMFTSYLIIRNKI